MSNNYSKFIAKKYRWFYIVFYILRLFPSNQFYFLSRVNIWRIWIFMWLKVSVFKRSKLSFCWILPWTQIFIIRLQKVGVCAVWWQIMLEKLLENENAAIIFQKTDVWREYSKKWKRESVGFLNKLCLEPPNKLIITLSELIKISWDFCRRLVTKKELFWAQKSLKISDH